MNAKNNALATPASALVDSVDPVSAETVKTPHNEFILSADQDKAAKRIVNFLLDPEQKHLILQGYAGTGKSTLLRYILDSLPRINQLVEIVGNDKKEQTKIYLTATTNKAVGALIQTTGQSAVTIHRLLHLVLQRNMDTGNRELISTTQQAIKGEHIVIIDEAYMAASNILEFVDTLAPDCKILWVGDPAQLLPIGMDYTPLSQCNYETTTLNEIVRQQKDNPIIQLTSLCRHAVNTGEFFKFTPDGDCIRHVDRNTFKQEMLKDFENQKTAGEVKVLSWTNKQTIAWNAHVKKHISGVTGFKVGDYVVCNSAIRTGTARLNTDQTVQITDIQEDAELGVAGLRCRLDDNHTVFVPNNPKDKHALIKSLSASTDSKAKNQLYQIEDTWADLRDEYACTINKSQGSTYRKAYIDLTDISKCRDPNQLARLLYVATSRASDQIVFTGDIA